MSEITKLYENAGIDYEERYNNCTLNKEGECKLKCSCDICKYSEEKYIYPSFTPEKQLEILKLILKKRRILDVGYIIEEDKYHCMHYEHVFDSFEEALCADVNYHWRDLTPEEKQQVKEILE